MQLVIPHPPKQHDKSQPKFIHHFRLEEAVGYGAWGKVKKGWDCEAGRAVAVKILSKKRIARKIRNGLERIKEEFEMLKELDHPNVVKYYALIETVKEEEENVSISSVESDDSESKTLASYRSLGDGKMFLVMEWLGGGKKKNLTARKLEGETLKSVLKQLLSAVAYLSAQRIAHHDIKPENIIYDDEEDKLTLIDFGVAERCVDDRSFCGFGTPAYQPPELIKRVDSKVPISGERSDLWSVGVVAFQLCTGELPFEGDSIHSVFENIIQQRPDWSKIPDPHLKSLIKGLLEKNPRKRLTAKAALEHFYFTGRKPSIWQRLFCVNK